MGYYLDKAGSGYSIKKTDTLRRHSKFLYAGRILKFIKEDNEFYLHTGARTAKKFMLKQVTGADNVTHNLNNAYYLDSYFKMSVSL